jgi:hypothetical protein
MTPVLRLHRHRDASLHGFEGFTLQRVGQKRTNVTLGNRAQTARFVSFKAFQGHVSDLIPWCKRYNISFRIASLPLCTSCLSAS